MKQRIFEIIEKAGLVISEKEREEIEYADFGLKRFAELGLALIVYVNTKRVCAKELVMLPNQICPEHRHPPIDDSPGKEETFRCIWGEMYLYVPGPPAANPSGRVPEDKKDQFTVWNQIVLKPGEQYTIYPNIKHWFQAGPDGAVVSEFSTTSRDEQDIFTDLNIQRVR